MATKYGSYLTTTSTTAAIRASAGFIESMFSTAGWVQTADTGQTAAASLPYVVAASVVGYQVWRMNDALQTTKPVYVKIEFGSYVSSAFAIYVTVGTGSDGAGNLTGQVGTRYLLYANVNDVSTTAPCYASGSTNRIAFAMFLWYALNGHTLMFSIERSKNVDMTDSGDGIIFCGATSVSNIGYYQYIPFSGVIRAPSSYPACPVPSGTGSLANGNTVGVLPLFPFSHTGPVNPGLGMLALYSPDMAANNVITVSVNGVDHTYVTVGGATNTWSSQSWISSVSSWSFVVLYE